MSIAAIDRLPVASNLRISIRSAIAKISDAQVQDHSLLGYLLLTAAKVAKQEGLEKGFRLIVNNGEEGGQTVYHLHIHILGGRPLQWTPD